MGETSGQPYGVLTWRGTAQICMWEYAPSMPDVDEES